MKLVTLTRVNLNLALTLALTLTLTLAITLILTKTLDRFGFAPAFEFYPLGDPLMGLRAVDTSARVICLGFRV